MARVVKGSHSFTCTPTRSSAVGMSHASLCLSSYSWYSFTDPGRMEGWVGLRYWLRSETGKSPISLLTGLNVEQLRWSRPTRHRYTKPLLAGRKDLLRHGWMFHIPGPASSGSNLVLWTVHQNFPTASCAWGRHNMSRPL